MLCDHKSSNLFIYYLSVMFLYSFKRKKVYDLRLISLFHFKPLFLQLQMKPLKELTFNSPDITATMTSRQFQVMLDVLTNLLFARLPK